AHAAAATTKYAITLASRSSRFVALRLERFPDATNDDLVHAVRAAAAALASVAAAAPPDARGFHIAGMADSEGSVAMACTELLVHAQDVANAFGLDFHPPGDLCAAVVDRLFPWAP